MYSLLVEDNLSDQKLMETFLKEHGQVEVVSDGKKGVEAFEQAHQHGQPYDVIFLDIKMPGLNGQEVLNIIRAKEKSLGIGGKKSVKVVMVTALDGAPNILGSFWGGCEAYLHKPVDKKSLIKTLTELELV